MRRKPGALLPLETHILAAAALFEARGGAEFHGYELAKQLRDLAEARRLVAHGTLYKALDRLQTAGLIESRWEDPEPAQAEGRPRRRLYRLTANGAAALARAVREPRPLGVRPLAKGAEA